MPFTKVRGTDLSGQLKILVKLCFWPLRILLHGFSPSWIRSCCVYWKTKNKKQKPTLCISGAGQFRSTLFKGPLYSSHHISNQAVYLLVSNHRPEFINYYSLNKTVHLQILTDETKRSKPPICSCWFSWSCWGESTPHFCFILLGVSGLETVLECCSPFFPDFLVKFFLSFYFLLFLSCSWFPIPWLSRKPTYFFSFSCGLSRTILILGFNTWLATFTLLEVVFEVQSS